MAGPNSASVNVKADRLLISWLLHVESQLNRQTDRASFLVYCPDKQLTLIFDRAVNRGTLESELALPVGVTASPLHVYMSFVSADGKVVSDSRYLGLF